MRLLISILFFILITGPSGAQEKFSCSDKNFTYKVFVDSVYSPQAYTYNCSITKIIISRKTNHKIIQTIVPPENDCSCRSTSDLFILEDVNFDGRNDFRLRQFLPAAPNIPYYYWIYNDKSKKFQRDTLLEEITSPDFDPKTKEITSFWRGSCCDHGLSTYKYINGKIVMIEEVEVFTDPDDNTKIITTTKKRINGKLKLVKRKVDIDKDAEKQ